MDQTWLIVLLYGLPILLMIGGLVVGAMLEHRHFKSIAIREAHFQHYPAVPTRFWDESRTVAESQLVTASVVVSLDYFKRFLASLRNLFGGRVGSFESLLDRAKREAILRLQESAPEADMIVNLRLQTANIATVHRQAKGIGGVEVFAFGTAIRYAPATP